jgi:hypothetical protein
MKRENRYIVLKADDVEKYLDRDAQIQLERIRLSISLGRKNNGKGHTQYVCVANDWPMYEAVWRLIELWVDTPAALEMASRTAKEGLTIFNEVLTEKQLAAQSKQLAEYRKVIKAYQSDKKSLSKQLKILAHEVQRYRAAERLAPDEMIGNIGACACVGPMPECKCIKRKRLVDEALSSIDNVEAG